MAGIPGIEGVSYARYRGGWKLRWRETHETPDGHAVKARSVTVTTEADVPSTALAIRRALDQRGWWDPNEVSSPVKARPLDVDIEAIAGEWVARKVGRLRLAESTKANLKGSVQRFFEGVRAVAELPEDGPIPARHLTRDTVEQVTVWLAERYAEGTVYQTLYPVLKEFWPWASDHGVAGLEPAPRDVKSLMPKNAVYAPPNVLPTLAEVDAMIARITVTRARVAAVLMRATGLRIEQVTCIRGSDIDPVVNTLVIAKGESRREKAMMRTVAIPTWLVPMLKDLRAWKAGVIIPHMDRYGGVYDQVMPSPRNLAIHFKRAWTRAVKDGVARPGIWAPGNRAKASTTHVLRAVYQATLEEAGVRDSVIDWLVGHAGRSTRATSYTKPSMDMLRAAVERVPVVANVTWRSGERTERAQE
jgi:site-specific recombinase XerD